MRLLLRASDMRGPLPVASAMAISTRAPEVAEGQRLTTDPMARGASTVGVTGIDSHLEMLRSIQATLS